jgi:hypothetical protein
MYPSLRSAIRAYARRIRPINARTPMTANAMMMIVTSIKCSFRSPGSVPVQCGSKTSAF